MNKAARQGSDRAACIVAVMFTTALVAFIVFVNRDNANQMVELRKLLPEQGWFFFGLPYYE